MTKGGEGMAVESAIQLMLTFGLLIVAIMSSDKKK
ncbi:putative holin-like toxin [Bacillus licheniformis]|nr:putative holin-like toxin [Bacillus licheniformis]